MSFTAVWVRVGPQPPLPSPLPRRGEGTDGGEPMTPQMTAGSSATWNGWRIARWSAVAVLLLVPLAMMQVVPDWHWGPGAFVLVGIVLGGPVLLYEVAARRAASTAYGLGAALALATCFMLVWTTLVRDDGNGIGFLTLVLAAAVSAFAVRLRAGGMARAMLGMAGIQAFLGLMIATAPVATAAPRGAGGVLVMMGVFVALWLTAAACFRSARA